MSAGWRSEARQRLDAMTHPDLPDPISVDLRRALDALDAVLALHPAEDEPSVVEEGFTGPGGTWQEVPVLMCRGCWDPHPCPTVRAIEGDA